MREEYMVWLISDEFSGRIELELDESCIDDLELDIANPNNYRFSVSGRRGTTDSLSLSVSRNMNYEVIGTETQLHSNRSQSIYWGIDQFAKQLAGSRFSEGDTISNPDYPNFRLKVVDISEDNLRAGYNTKVVFPKMDREFRLGEVGNYGLIGTTYALLKRIYYHSV